MGEYRDLKQYYKTKEAVDMQSFSTAGFVIKVAEFLSVTLTERFQSQKVLDIGCGRGELVYAWHKLGVEAYGVDISDYAINHPIHKKIAKYLRVVDVDSDHLPFDDGIFDLVTVLDVLEHLSQPIFLLEELSRVVHEGGIVFMTTPTLPFESSLWRTFRIQSNPLHINVHSKQFWIRLFEKHQFGYAGELHSFIREINKSLVPANSPLQHWAIRLLRTKLGNIGNRIGMELICFITAALLFQKCGKKDTSIEGSLTREQS